MGRFGVILFINTVFGVVVTVSLLRVGSLPHEILPPERFHITGLENKNSGVRSMSERRRLGINLLVSCFVSAQCQQQVNANSYGGRDTHKPDESR